MRRKIIAGNWKMNKTCEETESYIREFLPLVAGYTHVDIVVCPPYTALYSAAQALRGTAVGLAAQNVFWKERGAYTGQIAPGMLIEVGCGYSIVGHSEARGRFGALEADFDDQLMRQFGDTDESVNRKARAALAAGLTPIICVGETIGERNAGRTDTIVKSQVDAALANIGADAAAGLIFAYEPVWAIGTGEVCGAEEADRVCGLIRSAVGRLHGSAAAESVRVQYGGSVKPDNAAELLAKSNIDGALVGGASLKAADLAAIVRAAS